MQLHSGSLACNASDLRSSARSSVDLHNMYTGLLGTQQIDGWALRMGRVGFISSSAVLALALTFGANLPAATVPAGFTETIISGPWTNAVGTAFETNGRMYVWEGTGQIWFKDPGDANYTLLLDIHDEVGKWGDHGMLGFALDLNFRINGYFYVLYVVDRYYLFHSTDPNYDPTAND